MIVLMPPSINCSYHARQSPKRSIDHVLVFIAHAGVVGAVYCRGLEASPRERNCALMKRAPRLGQRDLYFDYLVTDFYLIQ